MTKILSVRHTVYAVFKIPNDICLFDMEDNNKSENEGKPGSWWIKWAILYYIDIDGKVKEIERQETDDMKYPDESEDAYEFEDYSGDEDDSE